jgi:hypothetical protein
VLIEYRISSKDRIKEKCIRMKITKEEENYHRNKIFGRGIEKAERQEF